MNDWRQQMTTCIGKEKLKCSMQGIGKERRLKRDGRNWAREIRGVKL